VINARALTTERQ